MTIGLGGNDFGLFAQGIMGLGEVPARAPSTIGARLRDVVQAVRNRAPRALVAVVGYPRIVDPASSCPNLLPLTDAQEQEALALQTSLNDAMRRAAADSGALFVDLFPASRGHDICSKRPWVNGRHNLAGKASAYHPFGAEMRAVAREIELALATRGSMLG